MFFVCSPLCALELGVGWGSTSAQLGYQVTTAVGHRDFVWWRSCQKPSGSPGPGRGGPARRQARIWGAGRLCGAYASPRVSGEKETRRPPCLAPGSAGSLDVWSCPLPCFTDRETGLKASEAAALLDLCFVRVPAGRDLWRGGQRGPGQLFPAFTARMSQARTGLSCDLRGGSGPPMEAS